ncbi:MAG: tetratricopeptide repeat protein [Prevotella sp.]|nr:tetratricopeptide repeat protein [Prevotella sp.]
MVFRSQGEYSKAIEYFQRALDILEKSKGLDHPTTKKVRNRVEEMQAKIKEAEE